jgi:hypothetical protein
MEQLANILSAYTLTADMFEEADGSITLSLKEMDISANGKDEKCARRALGEDILEYAEEYMNDFKTWNSAPNRKSHFPYLLKAAMLGDASKLGDSIVCRHGKN